ncbi:hypothetical protein D3C80_1121530 [compost metagenome]
MPYRQILLLRRTPLRDPQLCQRLAFFHLLLAGTDIEFFHQPIGTGGNNLHPTLIRRYAAKSVKLLIQRAQLSGLNTYPQILLLARTDGHTALRLGLIGIARHQLHIHKGGFPRLIKALGRHHRIVPIQYLSFRFVCLRRGLPRRTQPIPGQPTADQRR